MIVLQAEINKEVELEILEYIFDSWATFVTQDLGWELSEALLVEVGEEMRELRRAMAPNSAPTNRARGACCQ